MSQSTTSSYRDEDFEEASWEDQLKEIEEAERWDQKGSSLIPESIRSQFIELFANFASSRRILSYKLMDTFSWDEAKCTLLYELFMRTANNRIDWLLAVIYRFYDESKLVITSVFTFVTFLDTASIAELVSDISDETIDYIAALIKYLQDSEINKMASLINESNFGETLNMLKYCDEPMAKHCRLCRVRRMADLEFRMRNGDIPDGMIRVPGCLPIYNKAELWAADDEKMFSFDFINTRVYWQKEVVDLLRICDACLLDVFQAIGSATRFVPVHNHFYTEKKLLLKQLRDEEEQRALLFSRISMERHRRRIRDFAIRALETQRLGIRRDNELAAKRAADAKRKQELEQTRANKAAMLHSASQQDEKWKNEELRSMRKATQTTREFAALNYHLGYDMERPFKPIREHPHSWLLVSQDATHSAEDGFKIAITKAAAETRFGLGKDEPKPDLLALTEWKTQAIDRHNAFLDRQAQLAKEAREQELAEYRYNLEYIDQRLRRIAREKKTRERMLEREEEDRIERRKADREARQRARISGYEAAERRLMEIEDDRSLKHRFLLFERALEAGERESMYDAEFEQCEVDRYWGFDLFEVRKRQEEERLRDFYKSRLDQVNQMLVHTKSIRPFKIEAALVDFNVEFALSPYHMEKQPRIGTGDDAGQLPPQLVNPSLLMHGPTEPTDK